MREGGKGSEGCSEEKRGRERGEMREGERGSEGGDMRKGVRGKEEGRKGILGRE